MVVCTIDTPTVNVDGGVYSVSVVATAVDGAVNLGPRSFTTSTTKTDTAARTAVATALANDIKTWRANLQTQQNAATILAQIKTAIEGML